VAEVSSHIVGFIHFVLHEDIIDGAPNAFITAFYVQEGYRGKGIGVQLLHEAIVASMERGATFIETSTLHSSAKAFYERHGFRQIFGDIGEVFLELDVAKLEAQ
jgi:GNAT superfamily N-acetyltransferase